MGKHGITGALTLWRYVIVLAVLSPAGVWALGLGDITLKSYLNEPLSAEVVLLDVQDLTADDIRVRLGTQSAFDRLGIDRAYFLTNIKFEVLVDDSAARIILTSTKPLLEPYLDFLVETRWPDGRLLREYTVLVDLPIDATSSAQSAGFSATASTEEQDRAALDATVSQLAASGASEDMTDRNFAKDTQAGPSVGGRYLVQHADTLWEIALEAVPPGATVEQTMLATVQMNADAFLGGNINGLKAGYVLEMPSEGDILTSQNEALLAVDQANQDWRAGIRRTPALRVVADVATEDQSMADDPFEAAFSSNEEDRATPSDIEDSINPAAGSDSQPNAVAEVPEAVEASNAADQSSVGGSEASPNASELLEIQARLTALSEQMGNLRNLVVLKDQQIAALEAQLAAQRESTVAGVNADVKDTESVRSFAPINRGFPWWAFALGGVALLGVGAVVYSRRVQQPVMILKRNLPTEREPSVSRPKELDPRPAAAPAPSQSAAPGQVQSKVENTATQPASDGERGYGQRLHNDYVDESVVTDAIAEADIYMAYGRHQQALNLLESAAQTNPDDSRALLKMIEIYLKNDRQEEAKSTAQKLEGMGNGHAFGEASRMLSEVIPAPSNLDLGELAEPVSEAPLTLDLEEEVLDEIMPYADPVPRDSADTAEVKSSGSTGSAAQAGPASDTLSYLSDDPFAQEDVALPPELAEVLGSDVPPPSAEADKEPEGLVYAAEVDPVDTQLDLARAYIDMGDEDGARPVLKEVIAAGDLRQQAEARELLINID